jgi:P2 family phage contractile tail tube protein
MLFSEGEAFIGEVMEVTLPKLNRKLEEWRGGGMDSPVSLDMGGEKLEMESTFGGPMRQILRQFAVTSVAGVGLRFRGAYQNDDTGGYDTIDVTVRGRHEEIDMGAQKLGEKSEFKVKSQLAYYKLEWNGRTEIEIDPINMVLNVDGIDLLAEQRAALGI